MVVEDFNLVGPLLRPTEANAVLLIDADAVLSLAVACEGLEAVARRALEVVEIGGGVQDKQFGARPSAKVGRKRAGGVAQKKFLGFLAYEGANHTFTNYTRNQRSARRNVPEFGTPTRSADSTRRRRRG